MRFIALIIAIALSGCCAKGGKMYFGKNKESMKTRTTKKGSKETHEGRSYELKLGK